MSDTIEVAKCATVFLPDLQHNTFGGICTLGRIAPLQGVRECVAGSSATKYTQVHRVVAISTNKSRLLSAVPSTRARREAEQEMSYDLFVVDVSGECVLDYCDISTMA